MMFSGFSAVTFSGGTSFFVFFYNFFFLILLYYSYEICMPIFIKLRPFDLKLHYV